MIDVILLHLDPLRFDIPISCPEETSFYDTRKSRVAPSSFAILARACTEFARVRVFWAGANVRYVVTRLKRVFRRRTFYREFAKCITRPSSSALCVRSHKDAGFSSARLCHDAPYSLWHLLRAAGRSRCAHASLQINNVPRNKCNTLHPLTGFT